MTNYDENNVKKNKKGWSLITESTGEQETIDLQNFLPENQKGVNIVANSTYSADYNKITSSFFNDTITAKNGLYDITLQGYGTKKVTTGNFENKFTLGNHGKSTINAGNEKDTYIIGNGNNKIVDKGGLQNSYTISGGKNTITDYGTVDCTINDGENNIKVKSGSDKTNYFNLDTVWQSNYITTGASSDTYDIYVGGGSYANIKSGAGKDYINIYDIHYAVKPILDIDTGVGDDEVKINLRNAGASTNINNIKTGNGSDTVEIKAGALNKIDTGNDGDTVKIDGGISNYINTGKGGDTVEISGGYKNAVSTGDGNDTITVKIPDLIISTPTNIIRAGKGADTIELGFGVNTVYGEAGEDKITTSGTSINTIYADGDKINLNGGNNTIYTTKKGNTITTTDGANTINLKQGGNTLINNGNAYLEEVNVAGNNKITVNSNGAINITATSGAQTITLNDTGNIYGTLSKGNDIITSSSTVSDATNSLDAGAGNDKFYLSKGNKIYRGGAGNDYFRVTGYTGNGNVLWGDSGKDVFDIYKKCTVFAGDDNDTLNIKGGTNSSIDGGDGIDTFNIEGSEESMVASNTINGGNGNDIFNIKTLYSVANNYNGGKGVDTFNIYNGSNDKINGGEDNDIYNLYGSTGSTITDDNGANTYNIKKNYAGQTNIKDTTSSAKFVFDKDYKLSGESNVNNDVIVTDSNTVTLFANFSKSTGKIDGYMSLIFDIERDGYTDNYLYCQNTEAFNNTYKIKGKNYTLDFSVLEQNLVTWFNNHDSSYSGSLDVMNGTSTEDKASLMAVYTKDTTGCFKRI